MIDARSVSLAVLDGPLEGKLLEASPTAVIRTVEVALHDGGPWPSDDAVERSTLVEMATYVRKGNGWSCVAWNGPSVLELLVERELQYDVELLDRVASVYMPTRRSPRLMDETR